MQYHQIISWWDEAIGPDHVHVFSAQPEGPRRPLIRLFGLADMGREFRWLPFANAHENHSPGLATVEVVRRCNELGLDAPRNAAEQIEAKLGRGTGAYLTDTERTKLITYHQSGNHYLKSRLSECNFKRLSPNVANLGTKKSTLRECGRPNPGCKKKTRLFRPCYRAGHPSNASHLGVA